MAKIRICSDCIHNNNGWCMVRKTNQGLKDLIECEYRKTDNLSALEECIKQKRFEVEIDNTSYNRGCLKGLELALAIMKE